MQLRGSRFNSSTAVKTTNVIPMRISLQYAFAIIALTVYGGQV